MHSLNIHSILHTKKYRQNILDASLVVVAECTLSQTVLIQHD